MEGVGGRIVRRLAEQLAVDEVEISGIIIFIDPAIGGRNVPARRRWRSTVRNQIGQDAVCATRMAGFSKSLRSHQRR